MAAPERIPKTAKQTPLLMIPPGAAPSAWVDIKDVMDTMKTRFEYALSMTPEKSAREGFPEEIEYMINHIEKTIYSLRSWVMEADHTVHSDLDDIWGYPVLAYQGQDLMKEAGDLAASAQKALELMFLRKFYLQLVTAKRLPLMEPPFGLCEEEKFLKRMREAGTPFLVCDATQEWGTVSQEENAHESRPSSKHSESATRPSSKDSKSATLQLLDDGGSYPVIEVSPSFSEITGYTAEEILGRNPRFLQQDVNKQTDYDRDIRKGIRECLSKDIPGRTFTPSPNSIPSPN